MSPFWSFVRQGFLLFLVISTVMFYAAPIPGDLNGMTNRLVVEGLLTSAAVFVVRVLWRGTRRLLGMVWRALHGR